MRTNKMKAKLKAGEVVVGAFNNIQVPAAVEIAGLLGMDFLIVDAEHTAITPETAEDLYRAAELRDISIVTRIGENSQQVIQKFMDAGSQGVLMPLVNTGEEARRVVDAVKYPPVGKRGMAGSRAAQFGIGIDFAQYVREANEQTLVAVQVETQQAIDNIDEILAVEGVDVIFFGPADISSSLGLHGQIKHPRVVSIIETLGQKARAAGKAVGTIARNVEDYAYYRERGFQWLCTGMSSLLAAGIQGYLSAIREYEANRGGQG